MLVTLFGQWLSGESDLNSLVLVAAIDVRLSNVTRRSREGAHYEELLLPYYCHRALSISHRRQNEALSCCSTRPQ